jgi:hypothetical protein
MGIFKYFRPPPIILKPTAILYSNFIGYKDSIFKGTCSSSYGFCFTSCKDWQRRDEQIWNTVESFQWRGKLF